MSCVTALLILAIGHVPLPASAADGVNVPVTMKAISFTHFGDSSVLQYGDVPVPAPSAGELLVRVRAASVNPADWKSRAGLYGKGPLAAPIIPGFDISGVVARVGAGVTAFKAGDAIYAMLPLNRSGGYAQFAIVPAGNAVTKPRSISDIDAAAVPLAALTAWQALFDAAKVAPGQTVLIHGGAGGVGHFAVQFAKAKGAKVIATGSARNAGFLRALGADQVIDYRSVRFEDRVKDVDAVLDTVGGDTLRRSYGIVKKGGALVSIVDDVDAAELSRHEIRGSHAIVRPDAGQLSEIGALIDAGKVKPRVSRILSLEAAAAAQDASAKGSTRGKIVLRIP